MLRRNRSPSCFPSIACFSIAADKVLIEEEERGEEGEGRGEEAGEEEAREVGSCAKHRHAKQKGRKCWFYSQCRKIALDLAFLVIPTFRTNAATRALRFSFSRRERRGLSPSHRSWLLESDFQGPSCDVQKASESEDDQPPSSRINFSSDVDSISATVLLLNLEKDEEEGKDEEGGGVVAASSSPPRKERSFLVFGFGWLRRQQPLQRAISPVSKALVRFSFPELRAATDGFPQGGMLGKGALSSVFRGKVRWLSVAVKRLEGPEKECAKAFYRELTIAGSLSNANVVPLVGYCVDRNGLFLVYKYVSGGSLDHHLYREGDGEANSAAGVGLSWRQRFKVALGTARAVEYLHFGTDKCIIHRDIKPSNILLSSNNTPKLCDFGLATWAEETSLPFLCKTVKGTFGYLAPEYFQHGKLSDKTDVYAFGVLLLELISGRKAIDTTRPQGDENLVVWARPLLQKGEGALKDLMDPRLTGSYSQVEVTRMVLAAAACLDVDDLSRPTIREAVEILCGNDGSNDGCAKLSGGCYLWEEMRTDSDMTSHLALAMLGVSDSEDEVVYDH